MSVYTRMFGRHLPCSVSDLLQIATPKLSTPRHECLASRATANQANHAELHRLALSCLASERPGLARKYLITALSRRPAPALHLALAVACEMLAQHHDAAAHLDAALSLIELSARPTRGLPSPHLILCAAGLAWERAGKWQKAAHRYNAALIRDPAGRFAHDRLVAIHLAQGHRSAASLHLRSILRHQPAELPPRICLAHLLQSDGCHDQAIWEYQQALCLEPDTWEMPIELSRQLQGMTSNDQAIDILEQLVSTQPHFPDLRMRLANLYSLRGDDDAARGEFRAALEIHPDYLECHIALARHEIRMQRHELAAEHLRRAIAINDQHVEIYVGLAMAQHLSAHHGQAVETLESAGRIATNSAVLLVQLGMLEMAQDGAADLEDIGGTELRTDWVEQLIDRCQVLLEMHPDFNDLRVHQGQLQRLLGDRQAAIRVLQDATLADPQDATAAACLGLALMDAGRVDDALQAFSQALHLDPQSAQLHYKLALICCGPLEFDLAIERLEHTTPPSVHRRLWHAIDQLQMSPAESLLPTETPVPLSGQ